MLNRPTFRFAQVNTFLAGVAGRVAFDEQPLLQGKIIMGLQTFTAPDQATDPEQRPLITTADALLLSLTFKDESTEVYQNIPYQAINQRLNAGVVMQNGGPMRINWPKSYLTISTAFATPNVVASVGVHYATPEEYRAFLDECRTGRG